MSDLSVIGCEEWFEVVGGVCDMKDERVGELGDFPFVTKFEDLLKGKCSERWLSRIETGLGAALQSLEASASVDSGGFNMYLHYSMVSVAARLAVYRAFEDQCVDGSADLGVVDEMRAAWQDLLDDGLVDVDCQVIAGGFWSTFVAEIRSSLLDEVPVTVAQAVEQFPRMAEHSAFVPLGGVCVDVTGISSDKFVSCTYSSLTEQQLILPVLSQRRYRELLRQVSRSRDEVHKWADQVGYDCNVVDAWLWLVSHWDTDGYCYQRLYHPAERWRVCLTLGPFPRAADAVVDTGWTSVRASVSRTTDCLHVHSCGVAGVIDFGAGDLVGSAPRGVTDIVAQSLVSDLVADCRRGRDRDKVELVVPTASEAAVAGARAFVAVTERMYAATGASLSPNSKHAGPRLFGLAADIDPDRVRVDMDRFKDLQARMSEGAAVSEHYFRAYRGRLRHKRRRPALPPIEGRGAVYHVFNLFAHGEYDDFGIWAEDPDFDLPGWRSYRCRIKQGEQLTVGFTDSTATDVRMDITGLGSIELNGGAMRSDGVVIWFTRSIRCKVAATGSKVYLRVSVPRQGLAMVLPAEWRRYGYVLGRHVVVRRNDVSSEAADFTVRVKQVETVSGLAVCTGERQLAAGYHRLRLSGLPGSAPVRVVLSVAADNAFSYASVAGLRLMPDNNNSVTFLTGLHGVQCSVHLIGASVVKVAVAQIIDDVVFDTVTAG